MKKKSLFVLGALLTANVCWAQDVKVEFFTPSIVHVVKGQPTKTLVVTAKPMEKGWSASNGQWKSKELTVRQDAQGNLTFLTAKGTVLLQEKNCDIKEARQTFTLDKDEAIYGLGTIQNGKMNRRGERKRMEQSNLEDFMNVLQSIKGWGIAEVGDGVDYYFMYGGSADGVIAQMRYLSGDVPMFPLWTFGYWQSKERYKTARETEGIVDQYRSLNVPLDGIIQDWQYWGSNYLWNAMDFLAEDFSNGKQMIDNVHKKHAHFMISIWATMHSVLWLVISIGNISRPSTTMALMHGGWTLPIPTSSIPRRVTMRILSLEAHGVHFVMLSRWKPCVASISHNVRTIVANVCSS